MPAQPPSAPLVPSSGGTHDPFDATIAGMFAGGSGDGRGRHARHDDADGPLDLSALHADDELLTALCSHDNSVADVDQEPELKSLLLSWRLDVDAEPIAELVDTDTAMLTIARSVRDRRRKPRYLVPLASAAAVLVIVFAGMGLAARDAHPGDTLWGLSQVLYADHARSVEAAAVVRTELTHASQALEQGHLGEAWNALAAAKASLPSVDNADGKAVLSAQQQNLLNQLAATTSVATPNPTPSDPSTVPVLAPAPTTTQEPVLPSTVVSTTPPTTTTTAPTTTTDPPTTTSASAVPQSDSFTPQQQDATTPNGNTPNVNTPDAGTTTASPTG
jgi:hypothetical protein